MIKPPNNSSGGVSGVAGGDLEGEYPDPSVLDDSHAHTGTTLSGITHTSIANANKDGLANIPSMRTLGTSSTQACAGNDARLSDSRVPKDAAGGDLSGTYPSPTVARVSGVVPSTIGLATLAETGTLGPASPYNVGATVQRIVVTGATTINLRAVSDYGNTDGVTVFNNSGSSVSVLVIPIGSDTLDGGVAGASSTYTIAARGALGLVKTGATAWGSVQSGSSSVATSARIYISDGILYAVGEYMSSPGVWTAASAPVAMTMVAGGAKVSLSGTDVTLASGAADIARPDPASLAGQGQCWHVALSSLGITSIPYASNLRMHLRVVGSKPTVAYGYWCGAMLLGAWATSSETHAYTALSYDSNHAVRYGFATGAFGNWGTNAAYQEGMMDVGYQYNTARWAYRDSAGSTAGIFGTGTPGTGTVTHLGVAVGAVYGATSASCTFANPQIRFTWTQGP